MKSAIYVGLVAAIFFTSWGAHAAQPGLSALLLKDEWPGALAFVTRARDRREDVCRLVASAQATHAGATYILRRLLMIRSLVTCSTNLATARRFLDADSPLLQAAAIELAQSLPVNQRAQLRGRLVALRDSRADSAVRLAITEYFDPGRKIASPPRPIE